MRPLRSRIAWIGIAAAALLFTAFGPAAALAGEELPSPVEKAIADSALAEGEKQILGAEAGLALRAGIPAEDIAVIIARGRERGVSGPLIAQIIAVAARTGEQGLPPRPVLNRIELGLARGVGGEQIIAVAGRLADRMHEAQPLVDALIRTGLGKGSARGREDAIAAAARALEKSLSPGAITGAGDRIRERGGTLMLFEKALGTMTGMIESGMLPDTAAQTVHDALKRGFTEKDLTKLERDVAEGMQRGRGSGSDRPDRDDSRRDRSGRGQSHGGRGR
ncbi:MAG: hypothetical protein M0042_14420 [Nitrospiraceae bacterium]|nr:hypothetical protein [Nitrospiraceae bacterium]